MCMFVSIEIITYFLFLVSISAILNTFVTWLSISALLVTCYLCLNLALHLTKWNLEPLSQSDWQTTAVFCDCDAILQSGAHLVIYLSSVTLLINYHLQMQCRHIKKEGYLLICKKKRTKRQFLRKVDLRLYPPKLHISYETKPLGAQSWISS